MKQTDVERYKARIRELQEKLARIKGPDIVEWRPDTDTRDIVEGCFAGAVSVIESLYGTNSSQLKSLFETKKAFAHTRYSLPHEQYSLAQSIRGVLNNTLEEIDKGLIRNMKAEVAGEVIGDMLELARVQLKAGFVSVASVLSSAALEDALKRKATDLGLNVSGKTLDTVVNALKAQSFFRGAQGPIVSSFVKLRNSAMHADWDRIAESDVTSLIGFLEPFLMEHF